MESPTGVSSPAPAPLPPSPLSAASSRAAHAFLASLRAAFQPASVSALSSARARERSVLESFLHRTLQSRRSGAIYVTGAPGTGKTMLVTSILAQKRALCRDGGAGAAGDTEEASSLLAPHAAAAAETAAAASASSERCPSFRLVWLNAMTQADRGARLTGELEADAKDAHARALARGAQADGDADDSGSSGDDSDGAGRSGASKRKRYAPGSGAKNGGRGVKGDSSVTTILVVDEVDQLLLRSKSIILRLFSAPHVPHSRLVVIGIANKVSLTTDETLPLLTTAGAAPEVLVFSPYERDSLVAIAYHRVDAAATAAVAQAAAVEKGELTAGKGSSRKRPASSSVPTAAAAATATASAGLSAAARRLVFDPDALRMCAMAVARASGDARLFLGYCQDALVAAGAGARAARCPWAVEERRRDVAAAAAAAAAAVGGAAKDDDDNDDIVSAGEHDHDQEDTASEGESAHKHAKGVTASCTCVAGVLWQALLAAATAATAAGAVPSPATSSHAKTDSSPTPSPVAVAPAPPKPAPAPLTAGLPLVPFRLMSEVVARAQADKDVAPLVANLPRAQLTLLLVLALAEAFQVDGVVGGATTGGCSRKSVGRL